MNHSPHFAVINDLAGRAGRDRRADKQRGASTPGKAAGGYRQPTLTSWERQPNGPKRKSGRRKAAFLGEVFGTLTPDLDAMLADGHWHSLDERREIVDRSGRSCVDPRKAVDVLRRSERPLGGRRAARLALPPQGQWASISPVTTVTTG